MIKLPRNIHIWITSYIKQRIAQSLAPASTGRPRHVMFCFVDHYEPRHGKVDETIEHQRVQAWVDRYPAMASQFTDADGYHPIHSYFFPEEEYRPKHIEQLALLCKQGLGEVEVHLHHDNDTEEGFREKLSSFVDILHNRHGMLGKNINDGQPRYAFIHGNWALNNSRPDGRWCGVDNETDILLETGCYADLTMPSAPSDTQTSKINSIYYSADYNGKPKSHDTGIDVYAGMPETDKLLMIQGPLMLNWGTRNNRHLPPKIENGEFDYSNIPNTQRVQLWLKANIHIQNMNDWVFIKIHTHGASEENAEPILGEGSIQMHKALQSICNDGIENQLHYVSSREMYNIIRAAQDGHKGNPNEYRNYKIAPPEVMK